MSVWAVSLRYCEGAGYGGAAGDVVGVWTELCESGTEYCDTEGGTADY